MNQRDDLDRLLSAWGDDASPPPAPAYLGEVLERTRHVQQRPTWASLERWLPMAVITTPRPTYVPVRIAWYLLVTLLVLAIAAGGLIAGSRLLSTSDPIPMGGAAVLAFDTPDGDLFTIRADGTGRRQLTSGEERDAVPVWSPDGTRIAFRKTDSNGTSVAVIDAAGDTPRILFTSTTPKTGGCVPHAPAWSPDGAWLVFPDDDCSGLTDLYVVPADGSRPAQTFLAPGILGTAPAWSREPIDGTSIAFVSRDAAGEGIFIAIIPSERRIYAEPRFDAWRISKASDAHWAEPGWAPLTAPTWSPPDGLWVTAAAGTNNDCRYPTAGSMDAFIIKAWRPGQSTVAVGGAKEYNPTWSPDGQHLAFQRIVDPSEYVRGRPCTMGVWIADVDDTRVTNERRLSEKGTDDAQPPFWSPDGTRIVGNTVHVRDGVEHGDMYIETIDGSSTPVIVEDVGYATWQPVAAPLGPAGSAAAP